MPVLKHVKVAKAISQKHNTDKKLNLKQIASDLGIPENQARVYFKRHFKITFSEFVKRARLYFKKSRKIN
jgi:YesN/AraC family two-component response regulator